MKRIVSEADGYQPHLIAPEQGYRRLIEGALGYFRGPAEASVDAVSSLEAFRLSFLYIQDHNKFDALGTLCLERACEEVNCRNSGDTNNNPTDYFVTCILNLFQK